MNDMVVSWRLVWGELIFFALFSFELMIYITIPNQTQKSINHLFSLASVFSSLVVSNAFFFFFFYKCFDIFISKVEIHLIDNM